MSKSVVFRADASPSIGGGHVMRCLTLADRLRDEGWDTAWCCSEETRTTVPLLENSGHRIVREIAAADWLVIDHYGLGLEFEKSCRSRTGHIMVLDDMPTRPHDCDILVDQNPGRAPEEYNDLVPDSAMVVTGTAYALLRPQFAAARVAAASRTLSTAPPFRLLIAMGLTDPDNATGRILDFLSGGAPDIAIDIVLGSNAPHLNAVCRQAGDLPFEAVVRTDVNDMAGLYGEMDLVIGAAGSSAWERCCLGVPSLLVVLAKNQLRVAEALDARDAAVNLGRIGDLTPQAMAKAVRGVLGDPRKRIDLSKNSMLICDGLGVGRVSLLLDPETAGDGAAVQLRPANPKDGETILAWQSAPETRRHFRDAAIPTRDEHFSWLESRLADHGAYFHIIEHRGRPAGVLRLEGAKDGPDGFEVNILVAPENYRRGIAIAALRAARRLHAGMTMTAEVLPGNAPSHRLFKESGFLIKEDRYINRPKGA